MDQNSQTITLQDGRHLGYAEYGKSKGKPVLFFHGWRNSRYEAEFVDKSVVHTSMRLIGIDRPGYGISDAHPSRSLLDWPGDVIQLADKLNLPKFSVIGLSGGAPYAIACAYLIPNRINGVAIVSGLSQLNGHSLISHSQIRHRLFFEFNSMAPGIMRHSYSILAGFTRNFPESFIRRLRMTPGPDGELYQNPLLAQLRLKTVIEGSRNGVEGWIDDARIYSDPWGFDLGDITMQINLWHAEEDHLIPVSMAEGTTRAILNCSSNIIKGEGHVSLFVHYIDKILESLFLE